jgi:hypothetical protein
VGGRAELQRVEEEAELRPGLLVADAERAEDLRLHVGVVEADRAAADLEAVEHEVVAVAEHLARVALQRYCTQSSWGRVNAWCAGDPAVGPSRRTRRGGGSTTQRKFQSLSRVPYSGMSPSFLPRCSRRLAITVCTIAAVPNWKSSRSPGFAPVAALTAARNSGVALGEGRLRPRAVVGDAGAGEAAWRPCPCRTPPACRSRRGTAGARGHHQGLHDAARAGRAGRCPCGSPRPRPEHRHAAARRARRRAR